MSGRGGPLAKEVSAVLSTLRLLAESRLGFEGRRVKEDVEKKALEALIAAGQVQRPFDDPNYGKNRFDLEKDASAALSAARQALSSLAQGARGRRVPFGSDPKPTPFPSSKDSAGGSRFDPEMTLEEEARLIKEASLVGVKVTPTTVDTPQTPLAVNQGQNIYKPHLPKDYRVNLEYENKNLSQSRERKVPSSRIARVANFGALAVGLGTGAATEVARRAFGASGSASSFKSPFLTSANAERIVETLCRVRGAALKLGQMLSIQDDTLVPAFWLEIFERVRHSADFMPLSQVERQLSAALGPDWRQHFKQFEERPFAAASIGQVHRAESLDGRRLAVKVQYPGVAEGIDADIDNLVAILRVGGIFPKGMFLEEFVKVARRELKLECDYEREARAMQRMRDLLHDEPDFYVPGLFPHLSSARVLTSEFVEGKPVDACVGEPQQVRDYIAARFMELCLKEVFLFRFMQTDPNWSNFLFGRHPESGEPRLILLDFGAARTYPKKFVDLYMRILQAAYAGDQLAMLEFSRQIGFLTGFEDRVMERAHLDSISILAETLVAKEPYDFGKQDVTKRIHQLVPVMLERRLTSPPEEVYSLHRKLSGAYLLATKLKAVVSCGPIFQQIAAQYSFGEDGNVEMEAV